MFRRKGPSEYEVAKENEIKYGISQELSRALKTVQRENVGNEEQIVYSTDTANTVCSCLEAVFLHGLKVNTAKKIAGYMGLGQQALTQQSHNFWNFAAKFTHGEVVSQLKHLGQITTEIGLCRAWVRVALNDGLMESYVDAMVADKKTLEYYYHRTAYLRDSEQPGIMKTYIHGLMTFEFKLSYNASVLNEWSYAPLKLAGVIDTLDAPPPVIKPAASKPKKSKSSVALQEDQGNTSVDVTRIRSGSRGYLDTKDRQSKHTPTNNVNPMEQPRFGPMSDKSYYVTSSEFTSKDVEEFKKLAYGTSPMGQSECSSSSHISCPDPPHLNLSPAVYVQRKYGEPEGTNQWSTQSVKTDDSLDVSLEKYHEEESLPLPEQSNSKSNDKAITEILKKAKHDSQDMNKEVVNAEMDYEIKAESPDILKFSNDLLEEIYKSEMKIARDEDDRKANDESKNGLEESWEEFYKSPVKKLQEEDVAYRKVQRLESFNSEMKEEAILSSIVDLDDDSPMKTSSGTLIAAASGIKESADSDDNLLVSESNITVTGGDKVNVETEDFYTSTEDLSHDMPDSSSNLVKPLSTEAISKTINKPEQLYTKEVENLKQPEDETHVSTKGHVKNKLNMENLQQLAKEQSALDEKVVPVSNDKHERKEHKHSSPTKRKKGKHSTNKLKPEVSLSPPKTDALEPQLSDATADKVETVRTLENPDYLSKHRMSLPVSSLSSSPSSYLKSKDQRKSMPNVLEIDDDDRSAPPYSNTVDVGGNGTPYNIEEHLKAIYDGEPVDKIEDDVMDPDEERIRQSLMNDNHRQSLGNSLTLTGRGWSSSFEGEMEDTVDALSPPRPPGALPIVSRPKSESFGSLLQNYTPSSSLSAPSIDDVLQNLPRKQTVTSPTQSPPDEDMSQLEGFEVVMDSDNPDPNMLERLTQLEEIANEKGLAAQNFKCKGCARAVGLIFGKPRVCKFDGGYYCFECHENDEYYIPAVIVHNWDFRKHKVSKRNLAFLQDIEEQPHIDVEKTNPRLYDHVQEMQEIKMLRMQLVFLKTYLFSCKQSTAEDFRRLVWPRDYLYENIDLYSLADLLQVPTGALASSVRKVIKFATKHVYSCRLCSQKGFICELCNNPKVIYAFEMDATYRCDQCRTVFHKECKTDNRPCPKCLRRLHRESTHGISTSLSTPEYDIVEP